MCFDICSKNPVLMAMSPETKKAVVSSLVVLAIIGAVVLVVYFVSAKTSKKGSAAAPLVSAAPRLAGGSAIERDSMNVRAKMNAMMARTAGSHAATAAKVPSASDAQFISLGGTKKARNDTAGGLGALVEKITCEATELAESILPATRLLRDKGPARAQKQEKYSFQ